MTSLPTKLTGLATQILQLTNQLSQGCAGDQRRMREKVAKSRQLSPDRDLLRSPAGKVVASLFSRSLAATWLDSCIYMPLAPCLIYNIPFKPSSLPLLCKVNCSCNSVCITEPYKGEPNSHYSSEPPNNGTTLTRVVEGILS